MSTRAWADGARNGPRGSQDESLKLAPSSRLMPTKEPNNLSTLHQVSGKFMHAGTFSTPPGVAHTDAEHKFARPELVLEASGLLGA